MNAMKNNPPRIGLNSFGRAGRAALQWRLLLLWLIALSIPTLIAVLPMWRVMAQQFDHTIHAAQIAQQFQAWAMGDLISSVALNAMAFSGAGILGAALTLMLSPFLSGMVISSARAPRPLGMGGLMAGGAREYGRMARLLFWAAVPLGIAIGLGGVALHFAGNHAEKTILQTDANLMKNLALAWLVLLFVVAHTVVEAARADFALDSRRRSAIKALWHGVTLLCKRPLATLSMYLSISVIGLVVAALLSLVRINMPHVNVWGFIAAFLVTQLIVLVIAWMRCARLFALIAVAQASQPPQRLV
jgi:hypothetical protein